MSKLLLATDLDRTLLPNGAAPESPGARERFARLAAQPDVTVVYVTGRDVARVDEALATWGVPRPDVLIADVGTTIAEAGPGGWTRWSAWDEAIGADWGGRAAGDLQAMLGDVPGLQLQDASRQGRWKLSYETAPGAAAGAATAAAHIRARLADSDVRAGIVWSRDDNLDVGLVDVLPAGADKRRALEFVMARTGHSTADTVFAGDSGNDLEVLISPIPAVLVANAAPEFQAAAVRAAVEAGCRETLHLAGGGVLGLNGNYAAGILEGVLRYHPHRRAILEEPT